MWAKALFAVLTKFVFSLLKSGAPSAYKGQRARVGWQLACAYRA
jgi:hypothetical protein